MGRSLELWGQEIFAQAFPFSEMSLSAYRRVAYHLTYIVGHGTRLACGNLRYDIETAAAFRHLETPGGMRMSVAMTNCGGLGWVSDRRGYRYTTHDPLSGQPWPPLPASFSALAERAASVAGFENFEPDACLINRYVPGARLTLHQDKDEHDFGAPIVSVSLGLPAVFLFGGNARKDKQRRCRAQASRPA